MLISEDEKRAAYYHRKKKFFFAPSAQEAAVGWDLRLRDGTVLVFPEYSPLSAIRDRYGNQISVFRSGANITPVLSPNGRWIQFSYDSNNRVTQAKDNIGRTVKTGLNP